MLLPKANGAGLLNVAGLLGADPNCCCCPKEFDGSVFGDPKANGEPWEGC